MNTVLRYPGSKWRIADQLVSNIPEHKSYLEPYFGSGAVLFNKPPSPIETINDLDDDVINLFQCIRDHSQQLAAMIAATPYSRKVYDSQFSIVSKDPVDKACAFLIKCWHGYGFKTSGIKTGWKRAKTGRERAYNLSNWYHLPEWIEEIAERLRNIQIEHKPALDLIREFDSPDSFFYLDPPYLLNTRSAKQYQHEMTEEDHIQLLETIVHCSAQIMISGYDTPLYNDYLHTWDPEHIEIYSIVRPRNKEKGKEEDFFEIIKLIPDYMDMRFFMPNNMDQFYFKSEMKTKGIVSCEKFRKAQITDKQINEIEDVGFFMQLIDPKKHSAFILIPSKNFFTPFCRKLGIGKVNYGIDPIRDIYLASRLKDANPFVIVYRTNDPATYGKAFTCFSEKTVKIEQSCIFDYKDALAKIEPNIIRSWQYTHTRTDIDFSYPARSINLKQKCKITLGTRLSFSDIGECAFRLQNCIFTNGGTILLPQEASRKKSNKLSPEGIVKDYNSQCYMKFDKIMEQLKSYGTIPVTDMQQSVWNILEKLKFSSAFGFSNTRDLQKNYLSTFEKEGDALDVVIKILKIPGVLQRNYPGTTHDRVNECIGKIFNLKMEKLIV